MIVNERAKEMEFRHTNRKGFWIGFIDFFTAGIFLLFYMPLSSLQDEIETVIGHRVLPYWKAYLLGIPTLFIYPLIWMARISEELKEKACNGSRRAVHFLVAYVWLEHLWFAVNGSSCSHNAVL